MSTETEFEKPVKATIRLDLTAAVRELFGANATVCDAQFSMSRNRVTITIDKVTPGKYTPMEGQFEAIPYQRVVRGDSGFVRP
jgi:hypothetical protein